MVASCLYILDLKGKVLISRNYRGDIQPSAVDKFMPLLLAEEEEDAAGGGAGGSGDGGAAPPILSSDGINYLYIKHNNLYCKLLYSIF
jgi:AP-1 complex subunit mu